MCSRVQEGRHYNEKAVVVFCTARERYEDVFVFEEGCQWELSIIQRELNLKTAGSENI